MRKLSRLRQTTWSIMYKLFEALFGSKRIEYEYSVQVYFKPECDLINMKEIKI